MKNVLNILSKIWNVILNILIAFVGILTILALYYFSQLAIFKKSYPNVFGYTFFEVATGSMADTINIGDVVVVKIAADYTENDVIVYVEEDNFITHRVIKLEENSLIAKGDANNSPDKPVLKEQVLGKVIKVIPEIGIWKKVILSKPVSIGIILVVVLIGIIIYINPKVEEENEKNKD